MIIPLHGIWAPWFWCCRAAPNWMVLAKRVFLFRKTVYLILLSFLSNSCLIAGMFLWLGTQCTCTSCLLLRLYIRKNVGVAFCCLLLSLSAVSHWRAGVCVAFAGFWRAFLLMFSLCSRYTSVMCLASPLLREMGTLFLVTVWAWWCIWVGNWDAVLDRLSS